MCEMGETGEIGETNSVYVSTRVVDLNKCDDQDPLVSGSKCESEISLTAHGLLSLVSGSKCENVERWRPSCLLLHLS